MHENTLISTYADLMSALEAHHLAGETAISARIMLARKVADVTASGLTGKNETERKAELALLTEHEKENVAIAEAAERATGHTLELARTRVEALKQQLRLMEIMQRNPVLLSEA